jgi:hypothetical protein
MTQALVTRFAPSPCGLRHLGRAVGWSFVLRIEDIDASPCRGTALREAGRSPAELRRTGGYGQVRSNGRRRPVTRST